MTLSRLAVLANVSVSTVSKAFSGSTDINEKTREHIFGIAKEQGCFNRLFNAKYPAYVIAVLCPEYESRYYAVYLSRIRAILEKRGARMCVSATDFSGKSEKQIMEYYSKYAKADGLIVVGSAGGLTDSLGIPVVSLSSPSGKIGSCVTSDFHSGMKEAIQCFIRNGHTKIGYLGELKTRSSMETFKNIIESCGITPEKKYISIVSERFEKGGYLAMERLFSSGDDLPSAVMTGYDYMAIGAIRSIREHGLRVPEDISVCGIDNVDECEYLVPSLSSIGPDISSMCLLAVNVLFDSIENKTENNTETFCVEANFIKRESIGKCNDNENRRV